MIKAQQSTHSDSKLDYFFKKNKHLILACLMLLAAYIGFQAFLLMMADIKAYQAKRMIIRWETNNQISSQKDLDYAYHAIQSARWYAKDYPDFIAYEALIYKWHASTPEYLESNEQRHQLLKKALTLYVEEIKQRPTWPYAWSSYANTKMLLNEIDDEFTFAMNKAFYYGSWESQIQLEIINTGLDAWPKLQHETKRLIFKTYSYAFQGNKFMKDIVQKADDNNIFNLICLMPDKDKYQTYIQKKCDKALAAR